MIKINKKVLGIILIVFGSYLIIGNTIFSLLFNYAGPIGYYVPMSPSEYWRNWWNMYGLITVLVAVVGFTILILGMWILIKNRTKVNRRISLTESDQIH